MIINGKEYEYDNITISELVKNLNIDYKRVVIELNGIIIPKDKYQRAYLSKNDKLEIVHFVGGG